MPALAAARFNTDMKAKLEALVAAGKPAKVAITAVMRKLVGVRPSTRSASRSPRSPPTKRTRSPSS
jgi:transposase